MIEKNNIVLDDEKLKESALDSVCESCGQAFSRDEAGQPPRCPHCGSTKNFEKRPETK